MSSENSENSEDHSDPLPFSLDYIPDFLIERAKSELSEDEDTRTNSLNLMKSMLKEEPDLHWQDEDDFLLSFLRTRKFDVKRAVNLIKTFYTVVGKHDELYYNISREAVERTIQENSIGILPYRDSDGCVIILIRISNWNPKVNSLGDLMRYLSCSLLNATLSPATQIAGFKALVDVSGLSFSYLPHISPTYLWLMAEGLQNCFPGRFKGIHVVNEDHIFSYVWVIIKQFLTKKIKERFHFHGKNVHKLKKYFSPKILPAEYGGELPTYDNTEWGKMVLENFSYYEHVLSHGYEKYRKKAQEKHESKN